MEPDYLQHIHEVWETTQHMMMIAPAVLAAIISGGAGLLGSFFGGKNKEPQRIEDPYKDPIAAKMSEYLQGLVGMPRSPYPGQLEAGYNPVLLAALNAAMKGAGGYGGTLDQLVQRFSSPMGAQGWNPVAAGWHRYPQETEKKPSSSSGGN
jgi:hypothetical protein